MFAILKRRIMPTLLTAAIILAIPFSFSGCDSAFGVEQTNQELNIEYVPYNRGWLKPAVERFKGMYPDVKVNIEYHLEDTPESYNEYYTNLKTRLMAGKGPDIIFFDVSPSDTLWDMYKTMKAGAFADLNNFIDNDTEFKMEEYNSVIMQYGQLQEKRYLMPVVSYPLCLISTKDILDESGFDLESASKDWPSLTKAMTEYSKSYKEIPLSVDPWLCKEIFPCAGIDLINYDTNSINRDAAAEAKEAVRMYKKIFASLPGYGVTVADGDDVKALKNHQTVLLSTAMTDYQSFGYLDAQGEKMICVPVRDNEGKICVQDCGSVGVNNASPNQQNAWNLIKILLSEDVQKDFASTCVPVRLDVQEAYIEAHEKNRGQSKSLDAAIDQFEQIALYPEIVKSPQMDGYSKIFDFMEDYLEGRTDDLDKSFDEALVKLERYMSE